jgi:hypothetical protein
MFYIMSYNQIQGFFSGAFSDIDMLFYAGPDRDSRGTQGRKWVGLISEAQAFDSAEEAKELIHTVWGKGFSSSTFAIVEMNPEEAGANDGPARKVHDKHNDLGRRLATKHITKTELRAMADHPYDHGMTYRERWIIDIMEGISR